MTAGNVIWSTSKVEIPIVTETGAADWYGAGVITFTSELNIGVCMEIAGIRKIFEDGKLIYESSLGNH